jgi:lipooligosaccharide transport system permease protein
MATAAAAVPTTALGRTGSVTAWHARSFRRTWRATITTAFLNPIFFLLSVGVLLGRLVDDPQNLLGGLSYVEFVAPGLLAVVAMQVGAGEGMYPVMAGIKWLRTYHAVIATPVRVGELVVGTLGWAAIRIIVAATIFMAVGWVGGAFESPLVVFTPLAALLCGLAFTAPISVVGAGSEEDFWFPVINRFVIVPMFLFAGTFFPVSQLPDWLEPVAWITPLWHGVELCRDLATGSIAALPTVIHVAYLVAFIVGGVIGSVIVHRRRLLT